MNQFQITIRLEEIAAELTSIDAAIAAQAGVQSYTKGNDQTQLHPINTLYNRKAMLEKERRELWDRLSVLSGSTRPVVMRVVRC